MTSTETTKTKKEAEDALRLLLAAVAEANASTQLIRRLSTEPTKQA